MPDADPLDDLARALLGKWRLLRSDAALDFAPEVRMEFLSGGRLLYGFGTGAHRQIVALVYRVIGDTLQTDNPAAPHTTSTRFEIGVGEVLILDFAGARAWFVREL